MNESAENGPGPQLAKLTPVAPEAVSEPVDEALLLRACVTRILDFNPFYIISAALFLYGIYRLSTDPGMFGSDTKQLVFNFSSLQCYEVALVVTATWLCRRQIQHDSAVLVGLDNALVLVPFILVSHAVFIGRGLAAMLCLTGFAFAAARLLLVRRHLPELNLPWPLLVLGALVLGANSIFPFLFRSGLELTNEAWGMRGAFCWSFVLPALLAVANLLPPPFHGPASPLRKPWIPLACSLVWVLGTGVHLGSIGYIDQRPLTLATLLPVVWVLAWTLANRIGDLAPESRTRLQESFLALPLIPAATAMLVREQALALTLGLLNATLYAVLWLRLVYPRAARRWLGLSLAGLTALLLPAVTSLPTGAAPSSHTLFATLMLIVLFCALRSRNPKWGLLGAATAGLLVLALMPGTRLQGFAAGQAGLVFLLLHSLRWDDEERGSFALRLLTAVLWVLSAWATAAEGTLGQSRAILGLGFLVLQTYLLHRGFTHRWASWIIPAAAGLVISARPLRFAALHLHDTPAGLQAMGASLLLLAVGTVVALRRSRSLAARD